MVTELRRLVAWLRPEHLRRDCETWHGRCKLCCAVHSRPAGVPPLGAVKSFKPFLRMQWDMMEVNPHGEGGERYVLTAICAATKYVFLRTLLTRDSEEIAEAMVDVILDCGVVPLVNQSDNEFCAQAISEVIGLLGANQNFSTALRPQANGLVERMHRDMRAGLAMAVESLCRALPRRWPRHLRQLESRLRHKDLGDGHTPYSAVHGFRGASPLEVSLKAFLEIPVELVHGAWLQSIRQ